MTEVLNANEAVQRPLEFLTCFCGEELEADGDGLVCRNEEYKCPNHGSVFKPVMEWEMRGITRMGREKGILGL
ncbi:MAG: hypothetical protein H0Z28_07355 [Archaeoglobus sp.]|nr:hypothetical protein [Archaeoglobus sp.]